MVKKNYSNTEIVTKIKISHCEEKNHEFKLWEKKRQQLKLWPNSENQICDRTQNINSYKSQKLNCDKTLQS